MSSLIQSGDASRSDLDGVDTCGTLWNALVRVANSLSLDNFEFEQTNFAVHISRFVGAFLSTFETLLEASPNSIDVLLQDIVGVFFKNEQSARSNDQVVQLLKEYKDLFPFSYMFSRRSGKYPKSSFDTVNRYLKSKAQQNHPQHSPNSSNNSNFDDEDTFRDEGDDDTLGDSFPVENFPSILAPSLMPLKPFNSNSYEDQQQHSPSQPQSNNIGSGREYTDAVQQDTDPFSPDEASILDSYYNSWHRPSIEEDEEDSDQDHSQFMVKAPVRRATRMKGGGNKNDSSNNKGKATKTKPRRLTRRRPSTDPSDEETTTSKNVNNKVTTKSVSFAKETFHHAIHNLNDSDEVEELRLEDDVDDNEGEDHNQVHSFHLDEEDDDQNKANSRSTSQPISILRHSTRQDHGDHNDDSSLDLSDAERATRSRHQEPAKAIAPAPISSSGRRDPWVANNNSQQQEQSPPKQQAQPAAAVISHGHAGRRYESDPIDSYDREDSIEASGAWQSARPSTATTSSQQPLMQDSPQVESKLTAREQLRINMENFRRKKAAEREAKQAQAKSPVLHASLSSTGSSLSHQRQRYADSKNDEDDEEENLEFLPSHHTDKDDHFKPTFITKSMRFLEENDAEAVSKSLDKLRNLGYKSAWKPSFDEEEKAPSLLVIETNVGGSSVNASFESACTNTFRPQQQQQVPKPRQGADTPTMAMNTKKTTMQSSQEGGGSGVASWDSIEALQLYRGNGRDSNNNAAVLMASTSQPVTIFDDPFQQLPANITLPALSEYAIATGVIFEGPLQKKSSSAIIINRWQSRYLILKESTKCYCELQIYAKAVSSAWGNLPITKKASIPILDIASIEGGRKNGREFTLHFVPKIPTSKDSKQGGFFGNVFRRSNGGSKLTADNLRTSGNSNLPSRDGDVASIHSSDASSVGSGEGYYGGDIKELTLQADTPETRMIWVIMLNQALHATRDEIE